MQGPLKMMKKGDSTKQKFSPVKLIFCAASAVHEKGQVLQGMFQSS